jgi:hypothetical protein
LKPIVLSPNVNDYDTGENNLTWIVMGLVLC